MQEQAELPLLLMCFQPSPHKTTWMPTTCGVESAAETTAAAAAALTRQQSAFEGGLDRAFAVFTTVPTGQFHGCFPTRCGALSEHVGEQHLQAISKTAKAHI